MLGPAVFALSLLFLILFAGFFLWIGLKIMGKDKGILESGLANLAAGIFSFIILAIITVIPLLGLLSPFLGYIAYVYGLKTILKIGFFEALVASILASFVFFILSIILSLVAGIWVFQYTSFNQIPSGNIGF